MNLYSSSDSGISQSYHREVEHRICNPFSMDNQRKRPLEMDHKKSHYFKKQRNNFLVAGQRGFLATCNFREKECARECIKILNQHADDLYGTDDLHKSAPTDTGNEPADNEDISATLQKEINDTVTAHKQKTTRFHQTDTGASNSVFIRTTLADPVELAVHIVRQIAATKKQMSRFVLRLIPIEIVCKANMKDILNEAGKLFDKHFLNRPPTTYSIMVNRRYNNDLGRDALIGELAELIKFKNINHKVDLSTPALTVIVEIIKGLCCLSVVPQYLQLKKYNLFELAGRHENAAKTENGETKTDDANGNDSLANTTGSQEEPEKTVLKTPDNIKQSSVEASDSAGNEDEIKLSVEKTDET